MRTFDFSPLFRSTVGFDRVFDLMDSLAEQSNGYPPYNIERADETHYRITLAVAGFAQWGANFLVVQAFPPMAGSLGLAGTYAFYTVAAFVSYFLVKSLIKETKGKELEEMEGWTAPAAAGDAEVATTKLG